MRKFSTAALVAVMMVAAGAPVTGAPGGGAATIAGHVEDAAPIVEVRSRRAGAAIAAGIAGAVIGGIIASQARPYYGYPYGYYQPYAPYPYAAPYPSYDGSVAYCMRRFKSYDPVSMTYLGFDGYRHPCP